MVSKRRLEGFASRFGAAFYNLPVNDTHITLVADSWQAPQQMGFGSSRLTPLRAGETHTWHLAS